MTCTMGYTLGKRFFHLVVHNGHSFLAAGVRAGPTGRRYEAV